jgi:hypothetical protein
MAARRERERRRPPAGRQYRFGTPESAVEPDEAVANGEQAVEDAAENAVGKAVEKPAESPRARSRSSRATGLTAAPAATVSTRGGAGAGHRPFSEYKADYAYVLGDLRRVVMVIGSLLVILILLYLVLPH